MNCCGDPPRRKLDRGEEEEEARTMKASPRIVEPEPKGSTCAPFQHSVDKRGIFLHYVPVNH